MAKLYTVASAFFRAQPGGPGRNFTQPIVTRRLQSLLCCAARASFRLKSVTVAGAKQVLTGPSNGMWDMDKVVWAITQIGTVQSCKAKPKRGSISGGKAVFEVGIGRRTYYKAIEEGRI